MQPLGGFHTVNMTVGHSLGSKENIRFYLEMINIGDSRYSTVVGYPDYGRRMNVGIARPFSGFESWSLGVYFEASKSRYENTATSRKKKYGTEN